MWIDYLKYLIFLQKSETIRVLMGVLIFILSLYLLEHELTSKLLKGHGEDTISLIIILIIIKFIWEAFVTREEIKGYFHIQRSILRNNLTKPFVQPGKQEKADGFKAIEIPGNKSDLIFSSEKVSRFIQTTPLSIHLSNTKTEHIKSYIQKHREILLQYLNHYFFSSLHHNRQFTNDKKLCLSKDINLNSHHATCHTGGYYDSFVTNQVSGTTLIIKDKVHTTITTEHIFPAKQDETGEHYLSDIASSQMNDHLGCSTLGFTSDNYLIIGFQDSSSQFSKDMVVPTGSGSSNYSDLVNHSFQKTIIKTMERELMEEIAYSKEQSKQDETLKTMLLGFYRWVTRGGKPEFSGITKLPGSADQYKPNPRESRTGKQTLLKFKVDSIENLPKTLNQIRSKNRLSTPLYMCLYQLEEMHKNHKEELRQFMFS